MNIDSPLMLISILSATTLAAIIVSWIVLDRTLGFFIRHFDEMKVRRRTFEGASGIRNTLLGRMRLVDKLVEDYVDKCLDELCDQSDVSITIKVRWVSPHYVNIEVKERTDAS